MRLASLRCTAVILSTVVGTVLLSAGQALAQYPANSWNPDEQQPGGPRWAGLQSPASANEQRYQYLMELYQQRQQQAARLSRWPANPEQRYWYLSDLYRYHKQQVDLLSELSWHVRGAEVSALLRQQVEHRNAMQQVSHELSLARQDLDSYRARGRR